MENQNNNSSLKSLVILLSVLFALSLVYIYKLTTDVNSTEVKLTTTLSEKDQVMKDLKDLKTTWTSEKLKFDAILESVNNFNNQFKNADLPALQF